MCMQTIVSLAERIETVNVCFAHNLFWNSVWRAALSYVQSINFPFQREKEMLLLFLMSSSILAQSIDRVTSLRWGRLWFVGDASKVGMMIILFSLMLKGLFVLEAT